MNNFEKTLLMLEEMSPQLIAPLDTSVHQKEITSYYNANKSKFLPTNTEYLYKSGNDHNGYYIFIKDDTIDYFVKYKAISYQNILNGRMLRQVLVERFGHTIFSAGIPKEVFFDYLLPTFGSIITDTQQTVDGKKFWENAIHYALKNLNKYSIYVVDKKSSSHIAIKINSLKEFGVLVEHIWGTNECFKYMLVVIVLN